MKKRVFLTVLDSVGIGALPDAREYGDEGANTLKTISKSKYFDIPNLIKMGLGNIENNSYLGVTNTPIASYGRLAEKSRGKDTTVGHFEMCGIISSSPFPTYPNGFPEQIITKFEKRTGRGVICNKAYSGTEVIKDYGEEHLKSGSLIVYTSADSVFQIAAHEEIIPIDELYSYCRMAREILVGEHGVARVIARPFITKNGKFIRTANRRDFSILPPGETVLDKIKNSGLDVIAIGKINDIFAGQGITEATQTHSNSEGIELTLKTMKRDFTGLCFTNLVDFDMLYGHRQDIDGYAAALTEFDKSIPRFISLLDKDDVLIITADHGCDPGDDSTDHTREYVPLIIYSENINPKNLGTISGIDTVGKAVCYFLGIPY